MLIKVPGEREKGKLPIIQKAAGDVSDLRWIIRMLALNTEGPQKPSGDVKMQQESRVQAAAEQDSCWEFPRNPGRKNRSGKNIFHPS